jgi:hypothetical protein
MLDNLANIFVKTYSALLVVSMISFPALLGFLLLGRVGGQEVENVMILKR